MKLIVTLCIFFTSGLCQSQYQILEPTISTGVILNSVNNNYKLSATAGQTLTDSTSNNQFTIYSGFWYQYPVLLGIENEQDPLLPKVFNLNQNYPNPFNPVTTIDYALPKISQVSIYVYNVLGQQVADLVNKNQPAGFYSVQWYGINSDGNDVANGMYIYRITARSKDGQLFVKSKKMLFLK